MKVLVRESFRYANQIVAAHQDIDVFIRNSTTRAPLYLPTNPGASAPNPVKTDEAGNASFYVEEGLYDFFVFGLRVPFDVDSGDGGLPQRYVHTQAVPAASWTIHHNLGVSTAPTVVLDSDPQALAWTDMEVIDENTMALSFDSAVSGKAYL